MEELEVLRGAEKDSVGEDTGGKGGDGKEDVVMEEAGEVQEV